jgi:hypothetical protein
MKMNKTAKAYFMQDSLKVFVGPNCVSWNFYENLSQIFRKTAGTGGLCILFAMKEILVLHSLLLPSIFIFFEDFSFNLRSTF